MTSNTRTWLITGAARGLGLAITRAALEAGHNVVAGARSLTGLADLAKAHGERLIGVSLDVTDRAAADAAVATAVAAFGGIDVLVNNAGYADVAPIEEMAEDTFRAQFETNFFGVFNLSRAVLPTMRAQGSGRIIQISSVGGRIGGPGLGAYQSAKWAVNGFSEVLSREVASFGIKVTVVEPGGMRTDWAGSSMDVPPLSDAYAPVIAPVVERLRAADGKQPSDPARIAGVLLDIANTPEPPLRLLIGSDAVAVAAAAAERLAASDAQWRAVSESVAYPS